MAAADRQILEAAIKEVLRDLDDKKTYLPNSQAIQLARDLCGRWKLGGREFRRVVGTSNSASNSFRYFAFYLAALVQLLEEEIQARTPRLVELIEKEKKWVPLEKEIAPIRLIQRNKQLSSQLSALRETAASIEALALVRKANHPSRARKPKEKYELLRRRLRVCLIEEQFGVDTFSSILNPFSPDYRVGNCLDELLRDQPIKISGDGNTLQNLLNVDRHAIQAILKRTIKREGRETFYGYRDFLKVFDGLLRRPMRRSGFLADPNERLWVLKAIDYHVAHFKDAKPVIAQEFKKMLAGHISRLNKHVTKHAAKITQLQTKIATNLEKIAVLQRLIDSGKKDI